ncbi:MAG: hypothetical protein R3C18_02740 [Planctomycetaceae bacterium]
MPRGGDTAEQIRQTLINEAEFQSDLIERDYRFAHRKSIPLAAFAYRPLDARSACVGVVTSQAKHRDISEYRDLGAPLLLMENSGDFDLWRVGATPDRDERIASNLSVDETARFFRDHPDTLRPMRLYEAKTVARVDQAPKQLDLFSNFVDPNLLPFVENQTGTNLTTTVVAGIRSLVEAFGPDEWIIKAVFRLLAGKILRDKSVPGFKSATLSHIEELLGKVERHYGSKYPLKLNKKKVSALEGVMGEIQSLGDLRNLTTESLGDVYERALITPDIRRIHGTHKTPGYLVDYVVWQLAHWIEQIPVKELRFFEPGCGHAPFLVSLMRLLRTLSLPIPDLSLFVRERFTGIDNDPFALEIARLSLTVADEPNPDGWTGLVEADMYAEGFLEEAAAKSTVMLTNPPYETRKAEELLFRTLPHLPVGAVFGAVVPATLLFSDKKRAVKLRAWMTERCQLAEIDLFPDGLFTFGDHECALLIGRVVPNGTPTKSLHSRLRRVRDNDQSRNAFQHDYKFGTTRIFPQADFETHAEQPLWIAEFQSEIWDHLKHFARLCDIGSVSQGFQHKGVHLPKNAKTVADEPFEGAIEGFSSCAGDWGIHEHPSLKYLNLAREVIRTRGTGTDCVPQVLVNHSPASRGVWRLKPFVDDIGRPFRSTVMSVRIESIKLPNEYAWALLMGPVANLFAQTHSLKRHNLPKTLGQIPFPIVSSAETDRVASLARAYMLYARLDEYSMFNPGGFRPKALNDLLLKMDAEVLRLYRLPAQAERKLLEQFRGQKRPGIPAPFTEYYPANTPDVPLYAYRSASYQRALAGGSPELSEQELARYESLCEKDDNGKLTIREADRLHELQAEVDGRDYWLMYEGVRSEPIIEATVPDEFELRLRALSDRAATEAIKRSEQ